MANFDIAQQFTAKWEGCLSDHENDNGGLTHWGISLAFLTDVDSNPSMRQWLQSIGVHPLSVTRETISNLTIEQARMILRHEFWDRLQLDELPLRMGVLLYDAAVNTGRGQSVRFAQNGFNATGRGKDLAVDGILGPLTREALRNNDVHFVRQAILDVRQEFYMGLVRSNRSQKVFLRGWLNRVNDLRKYVEEI